MSDVIVRMWEVRTEPERVPELVNWVCETALPHVEVDPRHITSEVFSATERVVVISRWRGEPVPLGADSPCSYERNRYLRTSLCSLFSASCARGLKTYDVSPQSFATTIGH